MQGEQIDEDDVRAGRGARAADAGDGAADDESFGGGSGGADDGADFEEEDCEDEDVFRGEEGLPCVSKGFDKRT